MIPAIALMIAVYGTGRLINDGLARHPTAHVATAATWIVSAGPIALLWLLATLINFQGMAPLPDR